MMETASFMVDFMSEATPPLHSRGTPRLPDSDMLVQTESLSFPFASGTAAQKASPLPLILLWRTSRAATRKPWERDRKRNLRENPVLILRH